MNFVIVIFTTDLVGAQSWQEQEPTRGTESAVGQVVSIDKTCNNHHNNYDYDDERRPCGSHKQRGHTNLLRFKSLGLSHCSLSLSLTPSNYLSICLLAKLIMPK